MVGFVRRLVLKQRHKVNSDLACYAQCEGLLPVSHNYHGNQVLLHEILSLVLCIRKTPLLH